MLTKCPECELQVSDKALTCPHCGYPLSKQTQVRPRTIKRRRLPNGFGSITEIKNKPLRNRFRARVTVGKTPDGKPILKQLKPTCYFPTYNEAYEALMEYRRNPYDLNNDLTVKELYMKWSKEYFSDISPSATRSVTAAWSYCSSIYDMRAKDVRARHIKGCIEEGYRIGTKGKEKDKKIYPSPGIKSRIKSTFNLLLDYAEEYEIVDKNYARTFNLSDDIVEDIENSKKPHIIFSEDEIDKLWKNIGVVKYADWVIIQMYMGWRPQELATLRLDEVNMDEWYMKAGMKTNAGKQRIVPIHAKIKGLVKMNYDKAIELGSPYLFNDKGQTHAGSYAVTYDKYKNRFTKVIQQLKLNPEHRPHDPRKTFITRCKKANVDEYALKEMVGHNIQDITESTYTERDVEWLREDLEKIQ